MYSIQCPHCKQRIPSWRKPIRTWTWALRPSLRWEGRRCRHCGKTFWVDYGEGG